MDESLPQPLPASETAGTADDRAAPDAVPAPAAPEPDALPAGPVPARASAEETVAALIAALVLGVVAGAAIYLATGAWGNAVKVGAAVFAGGGAVLALVVARLPLTFAIARRELGAYFNTPIAWLFLVVFLLAVGGMYYYFLDGGNLTSALNRRADFQRFFHALVLGFLFLIPALSMRLWAEERRAGTFELLFTLPLKDWEVVLGKYLAGAVLVLAAVVLTVPIPLFVYYLGEPDLGPLVGGYFGAAVVALAFLALGAFVSSFSKNQILSYIVAFALLAALWLLGEPAALPAVIGRGELALRLIALSPYVHFEEISRGVLDLRDLVYFATFTVFFLFANAVAVGARRWWS